MRTHRIHLNGFDMVYKECGNPEGAAVVLLHGFCGSSNYWHKLCPLLSSNYRVIMPDLRGHGESSAPEGAYTMEKMADDVARLLDVLRIDKAVVFGHSLGGYVTAAFADAHSDKLAGFGLIHSTALPDTAEMKRKRIRDIVEIRAKGIAPYVRGIMPRLLPEKRRDELREDLKQMIEIGCRMAPEAAIRTLEGMLQRPDRSRVLAEAAVPVLLVAGEEDTVVEPDMTFTVSVMNAPCTTYKLPHILETAFEGVAHMSLVEVSDQLARVMLSYLQTLAEKERMVP
ncbi:alpha/beta fold hydrolase [Paenibacillus arenilitoris]|uniref:Alpha/beta hydrolase n=1 Tax=Paenibacillus arenilitoris TaxID=2772299 RepID=A0A927CLF8_9BACL|nr:alpha/beta hydrolase [Paenibacillus arenilitoris]MBD2868031.1 alpha/beta hydrolase [Paenibacillus arenilitoris]